MKSPFDSLIGLNSKYSHHFLFQVVTLHHLGNSIFNCSLEVFLLFGIKAQKDLGLFDEGISTGVVNGESQV